MEDFVSILNRKKEHYGCFSQAVIEFAAEEYATRKMIDENLSMLKMAKLHMDGRACIVLEQRISELEAMIRVAV
jgi:hypothetical protein